MVANVAHINTQAFMCSQIIHRENLLHTQHSSYISVVIGLMSLCTGLYNPFTRRSSGNECHGRSPWELRHFMEMPAQIEQFLLKFVQEISTRFFAAAAGEPLLVLVSLSLSGVSLRLSGLLA